VKPSGDGAGFVPRRVKALGGARPHGQADAERAAGKGAPDNGQAARLGAAAPMQP